MAGSTAEPPDEDAHAFDDCWSDFSDFDEFVVHADIYPDPTDPECDIEPIEIGPIADADDRPEDEVLANSHGHGVQDEQQENASKDLEEAIMW